MQTYIERFITTKIRRKLEKVPGVVILGPRQCGKSTLAKAIISDIGAAIYLDLERPSDVVLSEPEAGPEGGEGSRCARREARREGEGETILIITPTLILPQHLSTSTLHFL